MILITATIGTSVMAQNLSLDRILDAMAGSASLIQQKDTSDSALVNDLQIQVRDLSDHLLNNRDKINVVYLQILNRNSQVLDSVSSLDVYNSTTIRLLQNIVTDFQLKNANNPAWLIAETEKRLTTPIEVVTRKLLANGQFRLVNGYRVYANPWLDSVNKPAKVNFPNSTNPGSADDLLPGRYFIWAVPVNGPAKNYPLRLDFTDISYADNGKKQTFYIDITD